MESLHLVEPAALIIGVPAFLVWVMWLRHGTGRWWRLLVLALLVFAAARPELSFNRGGSDVVLILDRSASMAEARTRQDELIRLIGSQRRDGDRLAVILAADGSHIAQGPQHTGMPALGDHPIADTASDLADSLSLANTLFSNGRSGRVIIHSDGEITGADARDAATRLALRGIPVDVLTQQRADLPDAAILACDLPESLRLGESFLANVRFISDAQEVRMYRIVRDGKTVASGTVSLSPLMPVTIPFADRPPHAGVVQYHIELGNDKTAQMLDQFVALSERAKKMLPPEINVDEFIKKLKDYSQTEQGRALFEALSTPGPIRDAALENLRNFTQQQLGTVLGDLAYGFVKDTLDSPITERDRRPGNNKAVVSLRVDGGERILVMSGEGKPGNISKALRASGMQVDDRAEGKITLDDLLNYRVLVLDQVPADKLSLKGMEAIAQWVEHLGGGLVLTGGRKSFGSGGYHKSPVERVLPVTMELRDEHRKLAVAMAITLDRSGSMSMTVAGGRTKMDLANEGTAAVIELLGARDHVAVHAVDSAPHVIIPLTPVSNPKDMIQDVLGIESMGGGIYVYQALLAAGDELLKSKTGTRHLVLFADANDAEEPGDYKNLLNDYVAAGITVSVVALGSAKDSDAKFLEDVARRGRGRIAFAEAAEDIPRLFAQETMQVARSSWIGEPVRPVIKPALALDLSANDAFKGDWPILAGYNLTYPRDRARVWVVAPGDPTAPAVAAWQIGGGRAVAMPINVDDAEAPEFTRWGGFAPLLSGIVRWCGGAGHGPGRLTAQRDGRDVKLELTLDPADRDHWPVIAPTLGLAQAGSIAEPKLVQMQAIDAGRFEARIRLDDTSILVPATIVADQSILGPALNLLYHPEDEPRFGKIPGDKALAQLAEFGNGHVRSDLLGAFDNPPSAGQLIDLTFFLVCAAVVALILEILVRRLQLGFRKEKAKQAEHKTAPVRTSAAEPVTVLATHEPEASTAAPPPDQGLHEALRQLRKKK